MAIADDFTIDYVTQRIYHSSGTAVYSINELYTHLTLQFDDDLQMDDLPPMSAQTPTAFTMENGWFIDEISLRFLNSGSLTTLSWDAATYDGGIRVLTFSSNAGAIVSDIGKPVIYNGGSPTDSGILLSYNTTGTQWWVRVNDTGDTFQNTTTVVEITGGTGTGTLNTPSTTGESTWANIFTLGSLVSNTQIYLYQNNALIVPWWQLGHIDILIRIRENGTLIDNGLVTIFARKYTSLFDHYTADLSAGARTPIPIATFNDTANATGYRTFTGSSGVNSFQVREIIQKDGDPTTQGIITAIGGTIAAPVITYYLFAYPFTDFTATDTVNGLSSGASCTSGVPANTGPASLSGITLTFGASSQDLNNGNGTRPYDVIVNCNNNSLASTYEYLKLVNRYGNTTTINGHTSESYIAVGDIRLPYDNQTTAFVEGETVNGQTSGATGIIVANHDEGTTGALILRDITGTFQNNENIRSGATQRAVADIPTTIEVIAPSKQSPFGTFAGGKFFGARGVWLQNVPGYDQNNFELIDSEGIAQLPPQTISISVTSLANGDQVSVFRTTGDNEIIDKSLYTSHASNNVTNATTYTALQAIEADTPSQGFIRAVKRDSNGNALDEDRYEYQSWFGNTFTLAGGVTLLRDFTSDDTAYVAYIDETSTSTNITKTVTYVANRYVLTRVRQKGILPFTIKGQVTGSGLTVPAIRTTDTIQT